MNERQSSSEQGSSAQAAPPFSFQAKERTGKISSKSGSVLGRLFFLMLGILLVMVGVPMLILPGPGVLAIGAGLFCIVRALKGGRRKA